MPNTFLSMSSSHSSVKILDYKRIYYIKNQYTLSILFCTNTTDYVIKRCTAMFLADLTNKKQQHTRYRCQIRHLSAILPIT